MVERLHGMQEVTGSIPVFSTKIKSPFGDFFMPYTVYILFSETLDQYYVGQTENISDRIFRHRNSGSKSTKQADDWIIVYTEEYGTRSEAMQRELAIKKKKSRKHIEWLISGN